MPSFFDRLANAWNVFSNKDPTYDYQSRLNESVFSYRPDRPRLTMGNDRTIVASIYNRISISVASISIVHARLDDNGNYVETIKDRFNECLTLNANRDQTGFAFLQDVVMSMLDEGCVAIVPVDTTTDPRIRDSYDIETMRTGKILEWRPREVKVQVYNENTGQKEEVILPKNMVAIVENPFYSIMNERNSTLQRLNRKLYLLDAADDKTNSGKLDLIIQLPYAIKTEAREKQAEVRRQSIERQLNNSKYGIAYIDSTEHVTQLNRSLENNLLKQVEYWTNMLFSQLGITEGILNGTATEQEELNFFNNTVDPIVRAIVDEMVRKFLTPTARSQNQSIIYFRDPFKLIPVNQVAEVTDKMVRNEVMTKNEVRQKIGLKPSKDPNADVLSNPNISKSADAVNVNTDGQVIEENTQENEYLY